MEKSSSIYLVWHATLIGLDEWKSLPDTGLNGLTIDENIQANQISKTCGLYLTTMKLLMEDIRENLPRNG